MDSEPYPHDGNEKPPSFDAPGGKGAFDTDVGLGLSTVPGSSVIRGDRWKIPEPLRDHGGL